jgi:crotonobetainyl-CoA:carnitine CoA-transferase CaiB-like acyl-CoA transferase
LILSDLGAEVIKIEDPRGGDYARHFPPHCSDGTSAIFHALNRGKKSVALDLKDPGDRKTLLALVSKSDVLLESFRPGVMDRLGLSWPELHEHNPRLIVCSISGYGQDGPDALRAGHDLNYLARAGVLGMMKDPNPLPVQIADLAGGSYPAAMQIMAALVGRAASGQGVHIDVSMADSAHALLAMAVAEANAGEVIHGGEHFLSGSIPSYGVYESSDGHVAVGALEPKFWAGLCQALDLPELAMSGMDRGEEGARATATLQARFREKTTAEWESFFRDHDVCVEPVRMPHLAHREDAQLAHRGVMVPLMIGDQEFAVPTTPQSLVKAVPSRPAPALGADNEAVLSALVAKS